jgi:DNA-binding response OmpR family regulator
MVLTELSARYRWNIQLTGTPDETSEVLHHFKAPVVLLDRDLGDGDWRAVLGSLASEHETCILLLSHSIGDGLRDEVIGKGGYDVLPKPLQETEVLRMVRLAWWYWNASAKLSAQ